MTVADWPAWRTHAAWKAEAPTWRQGEVEAIARSEGDAAVAELCGLCEHETGFEHTGAAAPLREGLLCRHCRCNARQRAAAMVLLHALARPSDACVYATEQASPFYVALRHRLAHLSGSEFAVRLWRRLRLSFWLLRQGVPAWVRCEDVTALRWRDASQDGVISLDVLEHVPDHVAALREFARVLKPGGVLVLTVPFYEANADSAVIARLDAQGRIEHLGEPEFHGDPIRGGVPCFHHFGWDLLDALRNAGFSDAVACRVHDPARGLPQGQWVLRALR